MKKHLPNAITLLNLFFGCWAIILVTTQAYDWVFILVAASLAADFLDGMLARMLGAYSELGKQLDSLADVVSFGVLPGAILYQLWTYVDAFYFAGPPSNWAAPVVFLFPMMAAYRLGKFNLDERQTHDFLGLPTPAAAILTVGLLAIHQTDALGLSALVHHRGFLLSYILVISLLMISELPMISLKFKEWKWAGNEIRIIFVVIAGLCIPIFQWAAPALIIIIYIALSVGRRFFPSERSN